MINYFGRVFIFLSFLMGVGASYGKCRSDQIETGHGSLTHSVCRDEQKKYSHKLILGDANILVADFLAEADNNKSRSLWVYSGKGSSVTGCAERIFMVDISAQPTKVFAFGIKNACNEFSWASWGDKRSVIGLKKDVRFVYENGKLIAPKAGEQLWKSVEPPHAGPGLKIEDAIPFVEELPLPAAP